jgi:type I restriction enzyme, S subunit
MREVGIRWFGDVPRQWNTVRLKWTVGSSRNGVWGTDPDGENDLPCVRVADFDRQRFTVVPEVPTLRAIQPSERHNRILHRGDLLLEKSGGGELQPVGTVVRYDSDVPAVCSNFIARLTAAPGYDPRYLTYLHAALYSTKLTVRSIKQTTGIQNLDAYAYFSELVPSPPLGEQRVIADFLDRETARIDDLIQKQRNIFELLSHQRLALIRAAVTGGRANSVWGGTPSHWSSTKLGYVAKALGGATPDKSSLRFWNGEIPWVSPKDMKRRVIEDAEDHVTQESLAETALTMIPAPAVLIVVRGMILAHTFPVAVTAAPVTINQDMKALLPRTQVRAEYLAWLLEGISDFILAHVEQAAHGTCCLRTEVWRQISLRMPPVCEQDQICAELSDKTDKIGLAADTAQLGISRLSEYRSALISAAVTGQIDVRNYKPQEAAAVCP